jgi:hypothetical protein
VLLTQLAQPFRADVENFIDALERAGARVDIGTTFRPAERAYLMHWCCKIADGYPPRDVPPMDGVVIDWTHDDDIITARAAARAMRTAYGIVFPASLQSRHTQGLAIDMTIHWKGLITVTDAHGVPHDCIDQDDLWPIGASYGVHKLATDPPHWSSDGH